MKLDNFRESDNEVMMAMFDISEIKPGENHIDLGSGSGCFVAEAKRRDAVSTGVEIDTALIGRSEPSISNQIIQGDCFDTDVSKADVVTCWFTLLPETIFLMDKLYREMKVGARLVKQGETPHEWLPSKTTIVNRQRIFLYVKE